MRLLLILFSFFTLLQLNIAEGQESLVGHWSFDEVEQDTIYDQSGYGNHAINNGAKLVTGKKGNALEFNGKIDYVRIPGRDEETPSVLHDMGTGSISVWFKVNSIPVEHGIAPVFYYGAKDQCDFFDAANKGLIIELGHSPVHYRSKNLYFTIWKNGCTYPSFCYDSGKPISEGEWYHFVAVVGEDYNTGYLNGEEMTDRRYNFGNASYSQFFEDALAHERLWIGKGYWDRTTQYFDGVIDELKIYNEPLSDSEISDLYSSSGETTNIREAVNSEKIKLYPNPAKELLNYDIKDLEDEIEFIKILNMSGRTILSEKQRMNQQSVSIEQLSTGSYLIDFIGRTSTYRKKFIVTK